MKHDECTHPKTPAGRAACRKAGGPKGATVTHVTDTSKAPKVLRDLLTLDYTDAEKATQDEVGKKNQAIGERLQVKRRDERNPDLIDNVARLRKFVERRDWDDVIHTAWDRGWKIRNDGNDQIGRIYIDGSRGQIAIMWGRTEENLGSTKFTYRPWDTSIYRRVVSVGVAFSLAEGR